MRITFATRIVLTSVGSLLLVFALIAAAMYLLEQRDPATTAGFELADHVETFGESMHFDDNGQLTGIALPTQRQALYDGLPVDAAYRVLDARGRTVLQSQPGPASRLLQRIPFHDVKANVGATLGDPALRVYTVTLSGHGRTYYLQVGRSDRFVRSLQHYKGKIVMRAVLGAFLLALVVFTLVLALAVRRVIAPLRRVSAVAAQITPSNLADRIPTAGLPKELAPLIDGFNGALDRLETGFRVQQEFLASAAHELKTPLSLLRAEIEIRGRPEDQVLLDDIDFMSRQVHQLLHLAEVSETHNYRREDTDATDVVRIVLEYLDRLASARGVGLRLDCDADMLSPRADRGAFFVLVKNLVENAIQHSPEHAVVHIYLSTHGLSVRDAGTGIAAADIEHVFQRFWRGPGRETLGAGLGLAICSEIVRAHGWTIEARSNGEAPGATFEVAFGNVVVA